MGPPAGHTCRDISGTRADPTVILSLRKQIRTQICASDIMLGGQQLEVHEGACRLVCSAWEHLPHLQKPHTPPNSRGTDHMNYQDL